nr:DUF6296 family protein [Kitasatospora sp. RG8]
MTLPARYTITMPGTSGSHAPPEVVVVHFTGAYTSNGAPIYSDVPGTFQVEIAGGAARPLAATSGPGQHTCLHAVPLR